MNRGTERSTTFPNVSFKRVQEDRFDAELNLANRQVVGTGKNKIHAYLEALHRIGIGRDIIYQDSAFIPGRKNGLRLNVQIRGKSEQFTLYPVAIADDPCDSINLVRKAILFQMEIK